MFIKIENQDVQVSSIVSMEVKRFWFPAPDEEGAQDEVVFAVIVQLANRKELVVSRHSTQRDAEKALEAFTREAARARN